MGPGERSNNRDSEDPAGVHECLLRMTSVALALLAALVVFAWWRRRRQVGEIREGVSVEEGGSVAADDEPLDEEEIREAEDRFWEEAEWDEPEEHSP